MAHYDEEIDKIILDSGRQVYGVWGVIGIGGDLVPRYGFDGDIGGLDGPSEKLTDQELVEIADLAISYWEAFKAKLGSA